MKFQLLPLTILLFYSTSLFAQGDRVIEQDRMLETKIFQVRRGVKNGGNLERPYQVDILRSMKEEMDKITTEMMLELPDRAIVPFYENSYGVALNLIKVWEGHFAYLYIGYNHGLYLLKENWIARCDEKSCQKRNEIENSLIPKLVFNIVEEKSDSERKEDRIERLTKLMNNFKLNPIKRVVFHDTSATNEFKRLAIDYYTTNQANPSSNDTFIRFFVCNEEAELNEVQFSLNNNLEENCQIGVKEVIKKRGGKSILAPFFLAESYDEYFKNAKNEALVKELHHLLFAIATFEIGGAFFMASIPLKAESIGGTAIHLIKNGGYHQLPFRQQMVVQAFNFAASTYLDVFIDPLGYFQGKQLFQSAIDGSQEMKAAFHLSPEVKFEPKPGIPSVYSLYEKLKILTDAICDAGVAKVDLENLGSPTRKRLINSKEKVIRYTVDQGYTGLDDSKIAPAFKPYAFKVALRLKAAGGVGQEVIAPSQYRCEI